MAVRATSKNKATHRAAPFRATRRHHGNEAAEDYTELIAELIESNGEARTGDIARHLGISHVTALRTIQRLQREGYVLTSNHRPITLSEKGAKLARQARERHVLLVDFLVSIGVPPDIAEIDVEGAEHHIGAVTLGCIRKFMQRCKQTA